MKSNGTSDIGDNDEEPDATNDRKSEPNIENLPIHTKIEHIKKSKSTCSKRKKTRNESDPLITSISELMSTSLSIISPEAKLVNQASAMDSEAAVVSNEREKAVELEAQKPVKRKRGRPRKMRLLSDSDKVSCGGVAVKNGPVDRVKCNDLRGFLNLSESETECPEPVLKTDDTKPEDKTKEGNKHRPKSKLCSSLSLTKYKSKRECSQSSLNTFVQIKSVQLKESDVESNESCNEEVGFEECLKNVGQEAEIVSARHRMKSEKGTGEDAPKGKKYNKTTGKKENDSFYERHGAKEDDGIRRGSIKKPKKRKNINTDPQNNIKDENEFQSKKVHANTNVQQTHRKEGDDNKGRFSQDRVSDARNNVEENHEAINAIERRNAFEVMMESRHKSIGRNSPGKDLEAVEIDDRLPEEKLKLSARKSLLKEWSNARGGLKRKIEDQQKQLYISQKLDRRAKRMKKMLSISSSFHENNQTTSSKMYISSSLRENNQKTSSKTVNKFPKKRRVKKLNSETGSDTDDTVDLNGQKSKNFSVAEKTCTVIDVTENSQDSSFETKEVKSKSKGLFSFYGVLNKKVIKSEMFEDDESEEQVTTKLESAIKIKMFSPQVFKKLRKPLNKDPDRGAEDDDHKTRKRKGGKNINQTDLRSNKRKIKKSSEDRIEKDGKVKIGHKNDGGNKIEIPKNKVKRTEEMIDILDYEDSKSKPEKTESSKKINKAKNGFKREDILEIVDGASCEGKLESSYIEIFDENSFDCTRPTQKKGKQNKNASIFETGGFEDEKPGKTKGQVESIVEILDDNTFHCTSSKVVSKRKKRQHKLAISRTDTDEESAQSSESPEEVSVRRSSRHIEKKSYLETSDSVLVTSSDKDCDYDSYGESRTICKETKTPNEVKIAPVFLKATPKPKLDPSVIEARKNFLLSGVPDSLKRVMEKQQSIEDVEYDAFPSVCHVQQRTSYESRSLDYWNLARVDLKLPPYDHYCPKIEKLNLSPLIDCNGKDCKQPLLRLPEKIRNLKTVLQEIKANNPDYPVFKSFRFLQRKVGSKENCDTTFKENKKNTMKKRKRGCKSKTPQADAAESPKLWESEAVASDFAMWTEKFKAKSSMDIVGNGASTSKLKNWLQAWLEYSRETCKAKSKRSNSSSSEFESGDEESRYSVGTPGNAVILTGPHGSGKTMTVYAVCGELGINVLELNASSKRTGKRLLQELQEATQSHQVRKNEPNYVKSFLQTNKPKVWESAEDEPTKRKMCLLLVDDVDVVFDQDEGFLSALTQLLATSKRPIVLTASDTNCVHLQKFTSQYHVIQFSALSEKVLSTWLQVLCLLEGLKVERDALGELLEWNRGDARRTLLQLQFWSQSGGRVADDASQKRSNLLQAKRLSADEVMCEDDKSNQSCWDELSDGETQNVAAHSKCVQGFLGSSNFVPECASLDSVWWNLPSFLNVAPITHSFKADKPSGCKSTEFSQPIEDDDKSTDFGDKPTQFGDKSTEFFHKCTKFVDKSAMSGCISTNFDENSSNTKDTLPENDPSALRNAFEMFETLAAVDGTYTKLGMTRNAGPCQKFRRRSVKDSMELRECMDGYDGQKDFANDLTGYLLNGRLKLCLGGDQQRFDVALPESCERRWLSKQHACAEKFSELASLSYHTDRRAFALDYFPTLRTMSRSETRRSATNNKRRNRFYNYLRTLGFSYDDSVNQTACDMFSGGDSRDFKDS